MTDMENENKSTSILSLHHPHFMNSNFNENISEWNTNQRATMNQEEFDLRYNYSQPKKSNKAITLALTQYTSKFYKPFTSPHKLVSTIFSLIPIIQWIPKYSLNNLSSDIIGGLTVGIMHVPQGIAYASLAGQDPVIGLYTSLFPVITYMFLGTSRHCSIGSFAVVALMTGNVISKHTSSDSLQKLSNSTYTSTEIASTITVEIGIIQLLIAIFGLDFVCTYLSDDLVAGFTTGASMHVFVTQLKYIFGIYDLPRREGPGNLFLKLSDLLRNYSQVNIITTLLSACVIIILLLGRYFNNYIQKTKNTSIPIPFDLIMVILSTVVSIVFNLKSDHGVATVGKIPTGFPHPYLPKFELFFVLLPDALSITTVIMAIHISLAKMFAQKYDYTINNNQEFYALGITSLISGCFPTFPSASSLARTMVNGSVGTKTQLSSIFSTTLIIAIIMYFGKWLNPLPMCVLGCIIVVALLGMFRKFASLANLWKISRIDFSIWIIAFVSTTAIDVVLGLMISIAFALFTAVMRQQWPKWHVLANVTGTTEYRDVERYRNIFFFNGVCVFRFDSPLTFLNSEEFRKALHNILWKSTLADANTYEICLISQPSKHRKKRHVIIDCSGFVYVDRMGINTLKDIYTTMSQKDVMVFYAAAKATLREMFEQAGYHELVPRSSFFPTVHDAVATAQQEQ